MIRLRQIALIADDLDPVVDELRAALGLEVCFRDPGVGEFGLRNALLLVGDQFVEVLSPITERTAVGRLLAKRGGPGGYMVIHEVDDLDDRVDRVDTAGVRIVWSGDLPQIRGRHLHPGDVGGAIVSIDQPAEPGRWHWGGPEWESMAATGSTGAVDAIAGVTIAAADPDDCALRWAELGIDESVQFVRGAAGAVDGIARVDLHAVDRSRVGKRHSICGVEFVLV